jgi:hypothetical protein
MNERMAFKALGNFRKKRQTSMGLYAGMTNWSLPDPLHQLAAEASVLPASADLPLLAPAPERPLFSASLALSFPVVIP